MADSTTTIDQVSNQAAQREVTINENFDAASPAMFGGRRASTCVALTWGYYGGRWNSQEVADGTLSLAANSTNRVVVERATGEVMLDDSSPGAAWDDATNYLRLYEIVTGAASVTSYDDHRWLYGGGGGGGFGTVTSVAASVPSFLSVSGSPITSTGTLAITLSGTALPVANGGTGGTSASAARTALGLAIGTNVQAWDADLDTIASLTATTDSFLQSKSSAWAARTVAQVLTDLQGDGLTVDRAGFRGIPQNSQSAAYTLVAADAGKHIYHPSADTTARIWTIPANSSVAFPIGTAVTFINDTSGGVITLSITTDTLVLAGAGTTGSRSLAANGIATAVKVTSTRWQISGTGLT